MAPPASSDRLARNVLRKIGHGPPSGLQDDALLAHPLQRIHDRPVNHATSAHRAAVRHIRGGTVGAAASGDQQSTNATGQMCDAVLLRHGLTWPVGQGATHGAGNRMPRLGKIRRNQLVGNGRATDNVALPFPSRRWRARREWEVDAHSTQTLNAGATPRRGIPGPGNIGGWRPGSGFPRAIGDATAEREMPALTPD